jgi:hypothetical protein
LVVLLRRDVHVLDQVEQIDRPAGNEPRIQEDLAARCASLRCQRAHEVLPRAPPIAHPWAAGLPGAAGPGRTAAVRGEEVAGLDVREGGDAAPALRTCHNRARRGSGDQLLEGSHQSPSDGCGADVQQYVPRVRHDDHRGRRYPAEHSPQGVPLVPPAEVGLAGPDDAEGHVARLQLRDVHPRVANVRRWRDRLRLEDQHYRFQRRTRCRSMESSVNRASPQVDPVR